MEIVFLGGYLGMVVLISKIQEQRRKVTEVVGGLMMNRKMIRMIIAAVFAVSGVCYFFQKRVFVWSLVPGDRSIIRI